MNKSVFNKYIIDKIKSIINENDINVIGRDAKEISKDIWNLDHTYLGEIANDIYKKCEEEILYTLDRWDMYDIFNDMFADAIQEDILSEGEIGSYEWIDTVIVEKWTMNDLYKDIFENYLYHNFNLFIEQIIKEEEKRREEKNMNTTDMMINVITDAMDVILGRYDFYESEASALASLKLSEKELIKIIEQSDIESDIIKKSLQMRYKTEAGFTLIRHYLSKTVVQTFFKQSFYQLMETGKINIKNNEDRNSAWKNIVISKMEKEFKQKKNEIFNHYTMEDLFNESEIVARFIKAKKLINKYNFTIQELMQLYLFNNSLIEIAECIEVFEEDYYDFKMNFNKNYEENLIDFIKENLAWDFENLG